MAAGVVLAGLVTAVVTLTVHGGGTASHQVPPTAARPAGPRFMVVGDSISQGSSGDFTWRYRLYTRLRSEGVRARFVGPYDDLFDNVAQRQDGDRSYADPDFDQAHDAIWGRTLADEQRTIGAEVASARPDYLLVLIGINDLIFGANDPVGTDNDLRAFIDNARAAEPRIRIVLGELLPDQRTATDPAFAGLVSDYNRRMVQTANVESTAGSPVVIANDGADIDPATDLYDGTHPDAEGEVKIAAGFADALAAHFAIGAPVPRPYPTVPSGPRTPPRLSVSAGTAHLTLRWTASPGATDYVVYWRRAGGTFVRLPDPLPLSSSPWTGWFPPGCVCQVRIQPYKDPLGRQTNGGAFSNTVTATVG